MKIALDLVAWRKQFPAFANISDGQIEGYWDVATTIISPWESCLLNDGRLTIALNYLTAHIAYMATQPPAGGAGPGGVPPAGGVVTGVVVDKIQIQMAAPPTRDGWSYWLATSPYGQALWAFLSAWSAGGFYIGGRPERAAFRKVGGRFL